MDQLRLLTENINVFVRFFESINCLYYQLNWLQQNILYGSSEILFLMFTIILTVIYIMFNCLKSINNTYELTCSDTSIQIIIFSVIISIFLYFLYKRYLLRRNITIDNNNNINNQQDEREKFIHITAPLEIYDENDQEIGFQLQNISKKN